MSKEDGVYLAYTEVKKAHRGTPEKEQIITKLKGDEVYFRVTVNKDETCQFAYSENGRRFKEVGDKFKAVPGRWIGAKVGIFATRPDKINDAGYADYDWFRVEPL